MISAVSERVDKLIKAHLAEFPLDQNYVRLLLQNDEFSLADRGYLSWLTFNLKNVHRGNDLILRMTREIGPVEGARVLAIGAGGGGHSIAFQKAGCHVTSIEIDPVRLRWLRRRIADWGLPIKVLDKPIEVFNLIDKYDLVLCDNVIEHVSNWKTLLQTITKVGSGWAYVAWPNKYSVMNIWSDPHYRLLLAVLATGKWQELYLRLRCVKRKAWVTYIPSLNEVRAFLRKLSEGCQYRQLQPLSFQRISYPDNINDIRARFFVKACFTIGLSSAAIERMLTHQRSSHEIIFRANA